MFQRLNQCYWLIPTSSPHHSYFEMQIIKLIFILTFSFIFVIIFTVSGPVVSGVSSERRYLKAGDSQPTVHPWDTNTKFAVGGKDHIYSNFPNHNLNFRSLFFVLPKVKKKKIPKKCICQHTYDSCVNLSIHIFPPEITFITFYHFNLLLFFN